MNIEDVKKMAPHEKRIKIAELCGWSMRRDNEKGFTRFRYHSGKFCGNYAYPEVPEEGEQAEWVPDYLNDLNACHDMEWELMKRSDGEPCPDTWDRYIEVLAFLSGFPKTYLLVRSPASDRVDAFLAVMLP